MPRRHYHPSTCKVCDKRADEVGGISQTGFCTEHAVEACLSNVAQMVARSGPNFTRWRVGMIRSAGGLTLDDVAKLLETATDG